METMQGIAAAQSELKTVFSAASEGMNEAEVRYKIIDELLRILGWNKVEQAVEKYENGDFTDYELGQPRKVVVEAKRSNKQFDISVGKSRRRLLSDLTTLDRNFSETYEQCQKYCIARGVAIGVCTNGEQFVVFPSFRSDGKPLSESYAIVFYSADDIIDNFAEFWKILSPDAVNSGRTLSSLRSSGHDALPPKLSSTIVNFGNKRYRNDQQETLKSLGQIILEDIPATSAVEKAFLERCYCKPGAYSKFSLVTQNVLKTRYKGLAPEGNQLADRGNASQVVLSQSVWAEAVSRRPIVVLGDAGVGKTTFIRNLLLNNDAEAEIYIHINLGTDATFKTDIDGYILDEIDRQLNENYNIDIREKSFVTAAWHLDIQRFKRGIHADLFSDPATEAAATEKLNDFLEAETSSPEKHVKKAIHHLAEGRNKRIVVVLDNADQRNFNVQEDVYLKSQEMAAKWNCLVFVALRPVTFYKSKKIGAASAYSNRVFTIFPPRVDEVLEKRINFAVDVVEGRVALPNSGANLKVESVSLVLQAIQYSLTRNRDLVQFLSNITGGNIRELVQLTSRFLGSANVEFDKIIEIQRKSGDYIIPVHEFQKEALLGEYSFYDGESSLAHNVYEISSPSKKEHFLDLYILNFLMSKLPQRDSDGFVDKYSILQVMSDLGYDGDTVMFHLNRLNDKNLIENNLRVDPATNEDLLLSTEITELRITTIGAYHASVWCTEFSFLDCMMIDTPILDEGVREQLAPICSRFDIGARLERASKFRNYLNSCWDEHCSKAEFFNWPDTVELGRRSFESVQKFLRRR